jgi:hypothetical protein
LQMRDAGMRLLPPEAGSILQVLNRLGVASGPIINELAAASRGMPGVATPDAVAVAVREVIAGLRGIGFKGRAPNLERDVDAGTLQLVGIQRANCGVTGREPGFTVNLNVVHGALRRAWVETDHPKAHRPLRAVNAGLWERLYAGGSPDDGWWHPCDEQEAHAAAVEVLALMHSDGLVWLERWSDPDVVVGAFQEDDLIQNRTRLVLVAALLAERSGVARRTRVSQMLESRATADAEDQRLIEWLIRRLAPERAE